MLSLALGTGLNTAVFSAIDGLLLHPVPRARHAERLVVAYGLTGTRRTYLPFSYPDVLDYARRTRALAGLAAFQLVHIGLRGHDEVVETAAEMVTPNYFSILGLRPAVGRLLQESDNTAAGANPVAVLGYDLWVRAFSADRRIVGRTVEINRSTFTVVGVAPQGFRGINAFRSVDLWVPVLMYPVVFPFPKLFERRSEQTLQILGMLRPGISLSSAERDLNAVAADLGSEYPEDRKASVMLIPFAQATIHPASRPAFVRASALLGLMTGLLLLMACVNVANLLLASAAGRHLELLVRTSMGATRGAIFSQLLTENLLLFALGGAASIAVAMGAQRLLWVLKPPFLDDSLLSPHLDLRLLALSIGATVLTALLFGVLPAWLAARRDLRAASLRGKSGRRIGGRLVALQVCICSMCLVAAGFAVRNLIRASGTDVGFKTSRLLLASFDLQAQGYTPARGHVFQEQLIHEVASLPGVHSAALAENRLLGGAAMGHKVFSAEPGDDAEHAMLVMSNSIGNGYFETVGMRLLRGRSFSAADCEHCPPVAIVNERLATRLWPGRNAVGRHFMMDGGDAAVEVVGIAATAKYADIGEAARPFFYLPLAQSYTPRLTLHVSARGASGTLIHPVSHVFKSLDPWLPLTSVRTIEDTVARTLWLPRLTSGLFALFGLVALAVAGMGIYGVSSQVMQQRKHELAVRIALGARRLSILRLVARRSLALVAIGLAAGLATMPLAGRLVASPLTDPMTVLVAVVCVGLVGTGSHLLLLVKLLRVDPAEVLKTI